MQINCFHLIVLNNFSSVIASIEITFLFTPELPDYLHTFDFMQLLPPPLFDSKLIFLYLLRPQKSDPLSSALCEGGKTARWGRPARRRPLPRRRTNRAP